MLKKASESGWSDGDERADSGSVERQSKKLVDVLQQRLGWVDISYWYHQRCKESSAASHILSH